jgi:hypothetical protein
MAAATMLVSAAPAAAQVKPGGFVHPGGSANRGGSANAGAFGSNRPGALTGNWVGIEIPVGDGSVDAMTFGRTAGGKLFWHYRETNASGYCVPGGGTLIARGPASAHGNTVTVTITHAQCANGAPGAIPTPFTVTMTRTAGHINWDGVIFSRAGSGRVSPFAASYPELGFSMSCSGAHIVSSRRVEDLETCLVTGDTSSLVAGTYKGHPRGPVPWFSQPVLWVSDYNKAVARLWSLTYVNNGDGTWTVSVRAYY